MNRSERDRMSRLDTVLRRLDDAEKSALWEIKQAGFRVRDITAARRIQAEYREAARLQAHAVERMGDIARGRKTE